MRQRLLVAGLLAGLLALSSASCGSSPADPDGSVAQVDASVGSDAGALIDAGSAPPSGEPFTGPSNEWLYFPIEGARCGNGSTMPVMVNLGSDPDQVVVYLQGGGACWDAISCFAAGTASHINDTLDEPTMRAEVPNIIRAPESPWRDATWVYVPYCTGDVHAGTRVATYGTVGGDREVHHVGARNLDAILARVHATSPTPSRVTAVGVSAGAYGVTINFWRFRQRWPGVRVDVLADSGPAIDAPPSRFTAWLGAWDPEIPPGCEGCTTGFSAMMPHYAATVTEPHRFALLSYDADSVIRGFFSLNEQQFGDALDGVRAQMAASDYQRSFVLSGSQHTMLGEWGVSTSGGVSLGEWLAAFATDDSSWGDVGP